MLNPVTAKKLRPLRICLAVLLVILFVLVLDRLPTSKTVVKTTTASASTSESNDNANDTPLDFSSASYFFCSFTNLLDLLEDNLEARLTALGVLEEEYKNAEEYLSSSDLTEIEAQATLAAKLETTSVEASRSDLARLQRIFNLDDTYLSTYCNVSSPGEYASLASLLDAYDIDLTTTDEYNESL